MSFGAAPLVFVFVNMVVIGCTDADQQKPSSFLSSYDSYKNICSKIGWEPKCRKPPNSDCQGKVIAFHAFLSTRLIKIPSGTIIKFRRVLVNEGNGYDPNTGKFTAPVDGVYSFSWTYHTNKGSIAYLGGFVDGTLTAKIGNYHQTNAWENTSGHLIVKMRKGGQFWIQTFLSTTQQISQDYTSLSGYRISGC